MDVALQYNQEGLLPAVVQDFYSGEVLMLAWMNAEALTRTLEGGFACFYSRSRQKLWLKGETSGNFLKVKEICTDCDADSLLLRVVPYGPACHTGARTCFYQNLYTAGEDSHDAAIPV